MITHLTGLLTESELTEITIDVHGVGYEVIIPMSTFDKLPTLNQEVSLWIHTHVREDTFKLFGFATKEERTLFRTLLNNANGVGPKLALNILSCMSIERFVQAILDKDLKTLSAINGVGKRTAEKMAVDLKPYLEEFAVNPQSSNLAPSKSHSKMPLSNQMKDAIAALETLGFKSSLAEKTILEISDKLEEKDCSAENLIRQALTALNN